MILPSRHQRWCLGTGAGGRRQSASSRTRSRWLSSAGSFDCDERPLEQEACREFDADNSLGCVSAEVAKGAARVCPPGVRGVSARRGSTSRHRARCKNLVSTRKLRLQSPRENARQRLRRRAGEAPRVFWPRRPVRACRSLALRRHQWIVLTGGPGSGQSAILSNYLLRLETAGLGGHLRWAKSWLSRGTPEKSALGSLAARLITVKTAKDHRLVPQHFVRYGYQDWAVASAIEASLVEQVAELFPKLVDPKDKSVQRLPRLLLRASADVLVPKNRRLILVVDGVDQVEGDWSINPIFEFLPAELPDGVSVVCSARCLNAELLPLDWTSPVRLDLDSPEWAESSFAVQMEMLKAHAKQIGHTADYVNDAIKYADGNLRYLHELLQWKADYPRAPIDKTPPKFLSYLDEVWQCVNRFDGHRRDVLRAGLRPFADGERWVPEKTNRRQHRVDRARRCARIFQGGAARPHFQTGRRRRFLSCLSQELYADTSPPSSGMPM